MAPSRQERRKAERDAAKRAPAKTGAAGGAGAAGTAGAAAALANLTVNPLGDWKTQEVDPAVGPDRSRISQPTIDVHSLSFDARYAGLKCGE
jgi:hypothetical protein